MTAPPLRPYQREVIEQFHGAVAAGKRRVILVAPTGAGKTVIGADIINTTTRAQKRVLVLAHRREIINQTADKLRMNVIYPGMIMAGVQPRPLELVQLASIQTLWARSQHTGKMDLPPADLLVIDECHHATANTYQEDHRRLSRRDAAGPDRNAMSRRRARARRHLRHADRMPASRGADRSASTSSRPGAMRRSIQISTGVKTMLATTSRTSLPTAWTSPS